MSNPTTISYPITTINTTNPTSTNYLTSIGLGYSIAFALGFLVLLATILLASYICLRASRNRHTLNNNNNNNDNNNNNTNNNNLSEGIILPRIIFVAEDDEERGGEGGSQVGLDQAVINSYPMFQFSKTGPSSRGNNNNNNNNNIYNSDNTCSICLCEYKDSEMLRMMPECRHYFHVFCLDAWLKLNGSCPVCRNSPLPTPLSTPLSEVVPLSQYAADRRQRR